MMAKATESDVTVVVKVIIDQSLEELYGKCTS